MNNHSELDEILTKISSLAIEDKAIIVEKILGTAPVSVVIDNKGATFNEIVVQVVNLNENDFYSLVETYMKKRSRRNDC